MTTMISRHLDTLFLWVNLWQRQLVQDPKGINGEYFQCLTKDFNNKIFDITGSIQYATDLSITSQNIYTSRRQGATNKVERYTVKHTIDPDQCDKEVSAAQAMLSKFEGIRVPRKVAQRMNMRNSKDEFNTRKIPVRFPGVSEAYNNFYFTRFISWR